MQATTSIEEIITNQDYRGHLVRIQGSRELGWALSIDNGPLFCADRLEQIVYRAESYHTAFAVARQLIDTGVRSFR